MHVQSGFTRHLGLHFRAPHPVLVCAIFMNSRQVINAHFHIEVRARRGFLCFRRIALRVSERVPIARATFRFCWCLLQAWQVKAAKVICAQSSLLAQLTSSQNIAPTPTHPNLQRVWIKVIRSLTLFMYGHRFFLLVPMIADKLVRLCS